MNTKKAFTLIELLVVVAVLAILACFIVPVMAHSRGRSAAAGCLSNLRQLMAGWSMYREENSDLLMLNAPAGVNNGWITGLEGWNSSDSNTNAASLQTGKMWAYMNADPRVYRCPADVIPSDNGARLRSYSMNGQVGPSSSVPNYNPGWRQYGKGSDLTCPNPAGMFIFADEHPGSINDGYLEGNLASPSFPDVPASYLDGGCGFGFADGHAEIHLWQSSPLLIPSQAHVTVFNVAVSAANPDWQWLKLHSACKP